MLSLVGGLGLGLLLHVLRLIFLYYPYKGVPYMYFRKSNVHQNFLEYAIEYAFLLLLFQSTIYVNPHH